MINIISLLLLKWSNFYWKIFYKSFRSKYNIHRSFRFNGKEILFYGDGKIIIDSNSYIGSYSTVQAHGNCSIVIGKGCRISHNVRIYTSSLIADQDFSLPPLKEKIGNVVIGDYAWIGANVFINPGVNIGSNSIIGSNSVVTKDVGDFEIVGGIPAKLIKIKNSIQSCID